MSAHRGRLLTITEAAAELGIHQNTLRAWTNKGLVPFTKLPSGHRRFSQEQIEHIKELMGLEGKSKEGTPPPA